MPFLQCSSALFLSSSIELLLHFPCYASHGLVTYTASFSSALLNLLSFSCAFPFTGYAGLSLCCAFCGLTTCATFSFFIHKGYSLYLCPFFPYLKYSTSTTPTLLIVLPSFTSHCITLLDNTSNLFLRVGPLFFFSFLFLQFRARCLNPLQLQHSHSLFSSNFALNEVRACFCLSKLLINKLYCV